MLILPSSRACKLIWYLVLVKPTSPVAANGRRRRGWPGRRGNRRSSRSAGPTWPGSGRLKKSPSPQSGSDPTPTTGRPGHTLPSSQPISSRRPPKGHCLPAGRLETSRRQPRREPRRRWWRRLGRMRRESANPPLPNRCPRPSTRVSLVWPIRPRRASPPTTSLRRRQYPRVPPPTTPPCPPPTSRLPEDAHIASRDRVQWGTWRISHEGRRCGDASVRPRFKDHPWRASPWRASSAPSASRPSSAPGTPLRLRLRFWCSRK
ncbi:hypothetical protein VUR80DRAFT_2720 [Thermomyces stellatus]